MALPTAPRRSARLGSHNTRKRPRPSDSEQPSVSKLPEPTPRWIRAQKRQRILDGASPPPAAEDGKKRNSLIPDDEQQHRVVRKKRKENIVNDALTATAKISITLDTRQGSGSNLHHRRRNVEPQPRNTRSKSILSPPNSKPKSKSIPKSKPPCPPSSSSSSSRMMTRTMKKLAPKAELNSSPPAPTSSAIPSSCDISQPSDVPPPNSTTPPSDFPQSTDVPPNSTPTTITGSTITNDTQLFSCDTTASLPSAETTPPSLSKSPIDLSISISSLPMSFMNGPLSMPLNLTFLNMPLSMPLSMPLNISLSTDISTTLAPSESELGFGFHPQEQFSSNARENSKADEKDKEGEEYVFMNGERPNDSTTTRSSPDLSLSSPPSSLPPQSSTPCLDSLSTTPTTIPPISTCIPQPTSPTSATSAHTLSSHSSNPTSPTYSSPLKAICFPSLPGPPAQPFSSSQWPSSPSPSLPALLPSDERKTKEWDTMAMDMADDQRQSERALDQEMSMELALSFRNSGTGQGDAQLQGQQELREEQDRSPLLSLAPSPQPQASLPQLAPSFPSCPPSPSSCSSSPSTSSRQYHKKIEYHQMPEWTPKLDKERSLWKLACKIRVWEITKRYTPDTIRTVVAQEAHDYYSVHGFPLGYGSVPIKSRKRRWRKKVGPVGSGSAVAPAAEGSESDCASSCSSMMVTTSSLSSTTRDDEFMSEETYSFELMDDDDDMDASAGAVGVGLRSVEDEWRYEGLEDDEFGFEDYDDDDDEDEDDDMYEDDEVEAVDGDQTKIPENRKKKGVQSFTAGEDEDQDPDAEGEMEIDIEPFQDPSFNAELSSPTSPTSSSACSKSKFKPRLDAVESQSFVSSFYVPPVPPHMQHQQQRQEEQQHLEETSVLAPANPLSPSSTEGTPISTSDTADHTTPATPNNDNNHAPMQIHLPPASHHPQGIQLSSNILPLPPPRLDSVRVFILRQSEMGGLKTTGRGTPADRKRGAIWGGIGGGQVGANGSRSKRGLDDGNESESESDEEHEGDEGGKRGRPRLKLMLSDHDIEFEPRRGRSRQGEGGNGAKTTLRLSLPCDTDERMPIVPPGFKCDISESDNANNDEDIHRTTHKIPSSTSTTSTSTFVATDPTWDAFLASLDDKSQPQQQGEEGALDSSVSAADSDTTHGQLLLDLDGHRHRQRRYESDRDPLGNNNNNIGGGSGGIARRLGPSSSSPPIPPLESSSGMFMFDHGGDGSSPWFGSGPVESGEMAKSGVGVGGLVGSSGTCPSDALALEGFNFPVGPDGSSTLSFALG